MQGVNYFPDGYTEHGYIAAVPRLHGSLRFAYRPGLVEERSRLAGAAERLQRHLYDRHLAAFMADKLVSWDLVDAAGEPIAVERDVLLRLQPELFVKLHRIVLGSQPSDVDPQWPSDAVERLFDAATAAALNGQSIGEVREEYDEKN